MYSRKAIFITPIYCLPRIWTSGFPPGSIRRLSHFQEILVLGIFSWTYTRICFLALCFMNFWYPAIPRFEIRWIWGKCSDWEWQKGCIRSDFSQVKSSFWPRKTWVCNCADFESYSHKLTSPFLRLGDCEICFAALSSSESTVRKRIPRTVLGWSSTDTNWFLLSLTTSDAIFEFFYELPLRCLLSK